MLVRESAVEMLGIVLSKMTDNLDKKSELRYKLDKTVIPKMNIPH